MEETESLLVAKARMRVIMGGESQVTLPTTHTQRLSIGSNANGSLSLSNSNINAEDALELQYSFNDLSNAPQSTAAHRKSSPLKPANGSPLRPEQLLTFAADDDTTMPPSNRRLGHGAAYTSVNHVPTGNPKRTPKERQRRKRKRGQIGWEDSQSGEASSATESEPENEVSLPPVQALIEEEDPEGISKSLQEVGGASDMDLCTPAVADEDEEMTTQGDVGPTQPVEYSELPPLAESSRRQTLDRG